MGDNATPDDSTTDTGQLFERNPIIKVFDNPGNLRILITLIDAGGVPLTVKDISDGANINPQTFYNNEDLLLEYGLIEEAEQAGNARRFKVDLASDQIQALSQLYDTMIDAAPDSK